MRRVLLIILLIPSFLCTVIAQEYREKLNSLFNQLRHTSSDKARIDILNVIADFYQQKMDLPHRELDSCRLYSKQAMALSKKTGYTKGYWESLGNLYRSYSIANNHVKAFEVIENIYDTHVVRMLWSTGITFRSSIWRKPNFDSALVCFRKALLVSEKTGVEDFILVSTRYIISCYVKAGDTLTVQREMKAFERKFRPPQVAATWLSLGKDVIIDRQSYIPFKLSCFQRALNIFRQQADKRWTGDALLRIGDVYDVLGNTAMAEQYYFEATDLLKQTAYPEMYAVYLRLHDLYYYRGDLEKAVFYSLEAVRSAEKYGIKDFRRLFMYDDNAARQPGQIEKNSYTTATLIKGTVKAMVEAGKASEALNYALAEINKGINYTPMHSVINAEVLGFCYSNLGRYQEAEQYFLKMLDNTAALPKQFVALAHYTIGKFYYGTGQYVKAVPYLQQYLQFPHSSTATTGISEAHLYLYKIDSAKQDYNAALRHFRAYKEITDSIFSVAKSRQIGELKVQYDIEKKDQTLQLQQKDIDLLTKQKLLQQSLAEQRSKDVLLKQQNIDLLKQQQSLQEMVSNRQQLQLTQNKKELLLQKENINLLNNRDQLKESQLKQANFIKKMTITGILLLVVIVGLLYNQYRIKLRNNRQISVQNGKLHNLLEEKEDLLEEKEWLLKEVHHRVKNNLQVVSSLLQSQTVYLKDEALAAVHDSQRRVQAMSLIHQKLYQSENIATINMDVYIPELVESLKDSFVTPTYIAFIVDIAPVALDVTQAIPLGLIINEAVTNIFKHAFNGRERGQVNISLQALNEEELELIIADNGKGLPSDPAYYSPNSLGMNLMKGLCEDFDGRYTIENRNGTYIRIIFNRHIYQRMESSQYHLTDHEG